MGTVDFAGKFDLKTTFSTRNWSRKTIGPHKLIFVVLYFLLLEMRSSVRSANDFLHFNV